MKLSLLKLHIDIWCCFYTTLSSCVIAKSKRLANIWFYWQLIGNSNFNPKYIELIALDFLTRFNYPSLPLICCFCVTFCLCDWCWLLSLKRKLFCPVCGKLHKMTPVCAVNGKFCRNLSSHLRDFQCVQTAVISCEISSRVSVGRHHPWFHYPLIK